MFYMLVYNSFVLKVKKKSKYIEWRLISNQGNRIIKNEEIVIGCISFLGLPKQTNKKYHRLGDLNNRHIFWHSSGG